MKTFLLKYNKIYHFLQAGFYQVDVCFHPYVGTILKIERLDDFDFGSNSIDLRIVIVGKIAIGLQVEEIEGLDTFHFYEGNYYLFEEELSAILFLQFIEHGQVILGEKLQVIRKRSKKVELHQKSSLY